MIMPGVGGQQLGKRIKSNNEIQDTGLIVMTSMAQRGDLARMKEIGFAAYLPKPVKQTELYDCLTMLLSNRVEKRAQAPNTVITRHTVREARRCAVKILLVEDNIINQKVVISILKKNGFSADIAVHGAEAVEALRSRDYDIVLMDCQMPVMDGYTATRKIRDPETGAKNPQIPIIALTAHAMKGDRERCLECGMDDYMSKPFTPDAVIEMIDKWRPPDPALRDDPGRDSAEKASRLLSMETSFQADVFNIEILRNHLLENDAMVQTFLIRFIDRIPHLIMKCREAMDDEDPAALKKHLSVVAAAGRTAGCRRLSESAQDFLEKINSDSTPDLADCMKTMDGAFKQASSIIQFCIENDCVRRE